MFRADYIADYAEKVVEMLKDEGCWEEFVSSERQGNQFYDEICDRIRGEARRLVENCTLEHLGKLFDDADSSCVDTSYIEQIFEEYQENGYLGNFFDDLRSNLINLLSDIICVEVAIIAENAEMG